MLVYVPIPSFCSFLLNLSYFLDLGFYHELERRKSRFLSLFLLIRLLKMVT
jgi:hypothetical protein